MVMVMAMVMVMHDKFVLVAGSLLSRVDDLRTANCYNATTSGYVITYVCTSFNKYQVVLVLLRTSCQLVPSTSTSTSTSTLDNSSTS